MTEPLLWKFPGEGQGISLGEKIMSLGKTISNRGMDQQMDVQFMSNVIALVNEIKADYNLLRGGTLNANLGKPGLAEGTNANTLKTVADTNYTINGRTYTLSATDNLAMTACAQQAISTYCLYLVSVAAGGSTVTTTKGTSVATDTAVLPALPASQAPIGFFKVVTDASHTFTSGTTDLSAAGITATYGDLNTANGGASAAPAISTADLSLSV
jgi:hypothetical protein